MEITIIIFHYDDLQYLRGTVRQIERYSHPLVNHNIIIADQSPDRSLQAQIDYEFPDCRVVHLPAFGSGYSVDWIMRAGLIKTDFMCTIDVDAWPISKNWLYVPIKLIEEKGFDWVGIHAQIEHAYPQGEFYSMCMHFQVARTKSFDEASYFGGFTKFNHRQNVNHAPSPWRGWSDDGVIAHWWVDNNRNHRKLCLAVPDHLGHATTQGYFGRYSDDLFWHMGFSYTGRVVGNVHENMGMDFLGWMDRIRHGGLTDELCDEIVAKRKPLPSPIGRTMSEGGKPMQIPDELNDYIDNLKKCDI